MLEERSSKKKPQISAKLWFFSYINIELCHKSVTKTLLRVAERIVQSHVISPLRAKIQQKKPS